MRRVTQQWLMTSALALVGANVVVLPHTLSAIAEWSVGGAATRNPATTSKGCGCSQPVNRVMSEEEVRHIVSRQKEQASRSQKQQFEPAQRPRRPVPVPVPPIPIPIPSPPPPSQPPCNFPGCRPVGRPEKKEQCQRFSWWCLIQTLGKNVQVRYKYIFECPGGVRLVHCTPWYNTDICCHPGSFTPCDAGGQILCEKNGVPSEP